MDLGLRNKMVFIAGGAKGIASAIAGGGAEEGAFPLAVDKDARAHEQVERELRDARFLPWDLSSSENCKAMAEQAAQACGRSRTTEESDLSDSAEKTGDSAG
jgi:L-fucose dehydrogenase